MPPDEHTPPPNQPSLAVLAFQVTDMRGDVDGHHDRLNLMRSIQIATVGEDGKNGKLKILEGRMDNTDSWIKDATDTLQGINRRLDKQGWRLGLIVAGAGSIAGVAVVVAMKLLSGG